MRAILVYAVSPVPPRAGCRVLVHACVSVWLWQFLGSFVSQICVIATNVMTLHISIIRLAWQPASLNVHGVQQSGA